MEVPVELLRLNERKNNSGELHKRMTGFLTYVIAFGCCI